MAVPAEIPAEARALVKAFEGWSAVPYRCPARVWTIGWGALRGPDGRPVTAATLPLTPEEGEAMLARDLGLAGQGVLACATVPLPPLRFGALASFVFNLGAGRLRSSTLLRRLNAGDVEDAAAEFPKWVMAGGRTLPGLVRRREAERLLFLREGTGAAPAPVPKGLIADFVRGFAAGQAGAWR